MGRNKFAFWRARIAPLQLYVLAGAAGTALQYLILIALTSGGLLPPVLASCLGAVAGAVVNYWLNYRFTFRSGQKHLHAFPKFFAVGLTGLALNWLIMTLLVKQLNVYYILAQLVATAGVLALTFSLNSLWSFKDRAA